MAWAGNHKSNPIQSFLSGGGGGGVGARVVVAGFGFRTLKTLPGVVNRLEIRRLLSTDIGDR